VFPLLPEPLAPVLLCLRQHDGNLNQKRPILLSNVRCALSAGDFSAAWSSTSLRLRVDRSRLQRCRRLSAVLHKNILRA